MLDWGTIQPCLALLIIAAAVWAIIKGIDVRLALLVSAFILASLTGDPTPILREFLATFSNEKFVIPICTAMGFAYVLRYTECDQHLVRLLTNPLRHARFLLIPGVIAVGFLVNIPVISQTSTAVCIGAVVVPLMRAGRISSATIGATMLLGASIGGELLNPGAPELNTVGNRLGIPAREVIGYILPMVIPHLLIAGVIFWLTSIWHERKAQPTVPTEVETTEKLPINILRALVPIVPLILLFVTGPPLNLLPVPEGWIVDAKSKASYPTRLIGAAMLFGVFVAACACPRKGKGIPKAFFEGAGYAFAEIVSLIVTANCFGEAIKLIGLAQWMGWLLQQLPGLLLPAALFLPLAFAALSGSGMASTQSLYGLFVDPAHALNMNPIDVGAFVSIGSAAGRTMSPVAAVTLMCAKMTNTNPFTLAGRVAPPLLISLSLILLWRLFVGSFR